MTADAAVKDDTEPKQPPLFIEERPTFSDEDIPIGEVFDEPWGSPPDDALIRSVEMCGVLMPIIFVEDDLGLRIIEGRRRFQAARAAGLESVPGRVVSKETSEWAVHALTLAGNAQRSANSIMDLRAIEELMVGAGVDDPVEIAARSRAPLSLIRKRLHLAQMVHQLRTAWSAGALTNKVGEAASKLDQNQQRELVKRLDANGTVTMADVAEIKKTGVTAHQRTLPGDRWKERVREQLDKARVDVFANVGECDAFDLIVKAMKALDEIDDE